MNPEQTSSIYRRVSVHAALADATRLRIVDLLTTGDASSSELAAHLDVATNLLAHHVGVLRHAGLVRRHRSEGDGRRSYLSLVPDALESITPPALAAPRRMLFVCTANSARSHLAAALWARASEVPAMSAGTHPAEAIAPGAVDVAGRHDLPLLDDAAPRRLSDVAAPGDLVVTVCDRAHEELGAGARLHWSVPDPARDGSRAAFDAAYDALAVRVAALAPRVAVAS